MPVAAPIRAADAPNIGLAYGLAAFFCFTGVDSCVKWLSLAGAPTGQLTFVRFLVPVALTLALFLPSQGARLLATADRRLSAARALCLFGSTALGFMAVRWLPLTTTAAIFFTMPLIVCALSAPLLGERVGPRRWAAVAVGFGGVLIVTRPWGAEAHWALALAFGGAFAGALYTMVTRRLAGRDAPATQQLYAAGFCAVASAPLALGPLALAPWTWPTDAPGWAALGLIGVFGFLGQHCLVLGARHAPAAALAPTIYSQVVYATAASWLIFAQPPDLAAVIGGAVVVGSGLYVWRREQAPAPLVKTRAPR